MQTRFLALSPFSLLSYGIDVVFVNDFAFPRHVSLVGLGLSSAPPRLSYLPSVCDTDGASNQPCVFLTTLSLVIGQCMPNAYLLI